MNDVPATKPPLGVIPEAIHEQARCIELARAIHEYMQSGHPPLIEWVEELDRRLKRADLYRKIP
jgi:hypothetical protein